MASPPPGAPDSSRTARAREHLANERTLFAWIRTALALMGLGFGAGILATAVGMRRFLRARAQIEEARFVPELFGDVLIAAVTIAVGAGRLPGAVAVRDRHQGRGAQA